MKICTSRSEITAQTTLSSDPVLLGSYFSSHLSHAGYSGSGRQAWSKQAFARETPPAELFRLGASSDQLSTAPCNPVTRFKGRRLKVQTARCEPGFGCWALQSKQQEHGWNPGGTLPGPEADARTCGVTQSLHASSDSPSLLTQHTRTLFSHSEEPVWKF